MLCFAAKLDHNMMWLIRVNLIDSQTLRVRNSVTMAEHLIDRLNLPKPIESVLSATDITTVGMLQDRVNAGTLEDIPGIGSARAAQIRERLAAFEKQITSETGKVERRPDDGTKESAADGQKDSDFVHSWKAVVAVLIAIGSIVTGTYFVMDKFLVASLKQQLAIANAHLEAEQNKSGVLEAANERLRREKTQLLEDRDLPVPISPSSGGSVIGSQIILSWDYGQHNDESTQYTVQIQNLERNTGQTWHVTTPARRLMHIHDVADFLGRNVWRVRPGVLNLDGTHPKWSLYADFSLYPSTMDRIRQTGVLRVGITAYSVAKFNFVDANGDHSGFDAELIRWMCSRIENRIGKKCEVEFVSIPWRGLLQAVADYDVDVAISAISRSKQREIDNKIRFTDGYLVIGQVFVSKEQGRTFPDDLNGAVVGTANKSTNAEVGRHIADTYKFTVNDKYTDYADVYAALDRGDIDFALVDDVLAGFFLGTRFHQCGPTINDQLQEFYQEKLGTDREEYAIATSLHSAALIDHLNEILRSVDAQAQLSKLKKKWLPNVVSRSP